MVVAATITTDGTTEHKAEVITGVGDGELYGMEINEAFGSFSSSRDPSHSKQRDHYEGELLGISRRPRLLGFEKGTAETAKGDRCQVGQDPPRRNNVHVLELKRETL